jgi:hypothetical protein
MHHQARKLGNARTLLTLLMAVLAASLLMHAGQAISNASSGRVIDLFTQKAPFDGKGANQSSDAFEPQELVILYALVTYNDFPVALKLVSFQANGPPNTLENITVTGSATTNDSGIGEFSFRIAWPSSNPEAKVLGEWYVVSTVSIADQTVVDTLTFQVAWILRITSITTLNASFEPQNKFPRRSPIVFDVVVENIARVAKVATIAIDVLDLLQHPIIHIQKENLLFQPGQTHLNASSQIPANATIGQATAWASAYTAPVEQGGTLYSPAVYTTFEIIDSVSVRDVAITDVTPSKTDVVRGETVQITVTTNNKGDETESFNVTLYYDNVTIDTKRVSSLGPGTETQLVFQWNTNDVNPGKYVIKAIADIVEEETNIEDNTFVDGTVTIEPLFNLNIIMIFILIIILILIASLFLLFLLYYSRKRRRRRKKQPQSYYTIASRPHI